MSIINDDPNMQAVADANRGVAPVIGNAPTPIAVREIKEATGPSMPAGGLKPLGNPRPIPVDIETALADDTPGTASFSGPKQHYNFSDYAQTNSPGTDFIETPIENAAEEAPKTIEIVDETPETEDLINNTNEENKTMDNIQTSAPTQIPVQEPASAPAPVTMSAPEPVVAMPTPEPVVTPEPAAPVAAPAVEPTPDTAAPSTPADIVIDPDHAYEEANDGFFGVMREKLSTLRHERDELLKKIDDLEEEITVLERKNTQREIAGIYDNADYDHINNLDREKYELRDQVDTKERMIHSVLRTLRTL